MKRLSEMRDDDPLLEQAQQLLSAVEPLAPSHERMLRVRRELEQKRTERGAGLLSLLRGPRALALTGLLVFGGSTLAAAQTGVLHAVIARVSHVIRLSPVTIPAAPRRAPAAPKPHLPAAQVAAAPAVPVVSAIEPVPAPLAASEELVAPQRPSAGLKRHARAQAHVAPERADAEIVRRAVKALRRDADPTLAARLLEEARARSPHSALAEEVMSLRVEAALARGDDRARTYAREYLTRYPEGRYRSQVEKALAP